jgi:hypothetical protein
MDAATMSFLFTPDGLYTIQLHMSAQKMVELPLGYPSRRFSVAESTLWQALYGANTMYQIELSRRNIELTDHKFARLLMRYAPVGKILETHGIR